MAPTKASISDQSMLTEFISESGDSSGQQIELPLDLNPTNLQSLCDAVLQKPKDERVPFLFFINNIQIQESIRKTLEEISDEIKFDSEQVLKIVYAPQAVFKVEPVTRCTTSMAGHGEAIVCLQFSPDGASLASGSGDTTVRIWDMTTQTPLYTCQGHKNWVLALAWSPDCKQLASGCKNGQIILWDPSTGKQKNSASLSGHVKWITCLAWEPINYNPDCRRLASSSKDATIKIWDTVLCRCELTLSGHTMSVTCIKWSANGLIYSASQDTTIKVWRGSDGTLCRTLQGHAHWVNTLTLNCDYIVRTGPYEPSAIFQSKNNPDELKSSFDLANISRSELARIAQERYDKARAGNEDVIVSGSDDFTMFLWHPESKKEPIARLTGHQQLINDVKFSPDMRYIASASFDKSIRLWDGKDGKFIATLRGHVQRVHQLAWSSDSRLLVSGSADSTLKVWRILPKGSKLLNDLPGHADEVYVVDWSPDGDRVASGGKDKILKLWSR